ncbi:unnamed protein product [Tilletia controversa]|nr:unnamed protein product [Tilletia controversa]
MASGSSSWAGGVESAQSDSLITASVAVGYVLAEWSYHIEWESQDIWPRIFFPFCTALASSFSSARHAAYLVWQRPKTGSPACPSAPHPGSNVDNANANGSASQHTPSSDKSVPEWAKPPQHLSNWAFFQASYKPLNGPEWAYVVARIGSIGCAISALALHTVGNAGAGSADNQPSSARWIVPDRSCDAARRLVAIFNLFALSGSGAIILVRALALHKFRRPFEKPILWILWGSLQALILVEVIAMSSVSTHDGSRFCITGGNSLNVPNVITHLPYFLPILSSTLCFFLIARYLIAYRRQNREAWTAGLTFRLYLRDSFLHWLLTMALFLPLVIIYIIEQSHSPSLFTLDAMAIESAGQTHRAETEVHRWRVTAILNLCTACPAAYACRIFVNLRRCLEHDIGHGAAGGVGATAAYEYTTGMRGPGAGGVWTAGMGASRLRNRSAAAAAVSAGAGYTYPHPYPYPNPYQYPYAYPPGGNAQPTMVQQYQFPTNHLDPTALSNQYAYSNSNNNNHQQYPSATTSQPMYHQISRIYGGEQAMSMNAVPARWTGGSMGNGIAAGGGGVVGVGVGSNIGVGTAVRMGPRASTGTASAINQQQHSPQMAEPTSQVQFQLPGIHHQLGLPAIAPGAGVGPEGERRDQQGDGGLFGTGTATFPLGLGMAGQSQQPHAAMTGEFMQAMNASGLPFQLAPPPPPPVPFPLPFQNPYPALPERQLVVVQEDWGDTHPDLVFSLNGGLDDDEEDEQLQQHYGMGFSQSHGQGSGTGAVYALEMGTPPVAGGGVGPQVSASVSGSGLLASTAAPQTQSPTASYHPTSVSASMGYPPPPAGTSPAHSQARPQSQPQPHHQQQEQRAIGYDSHDQEEGEGDDDDGSWMDHPEECECDGCCETDTEANQPVRQVFEP